MNSTGKKTLESMSQAVWYNKWTMDKFKAFLHGDILEVGCGIGNFTNTLSDYGLVWSIDIEDNYIKQTKKSVGKKAVVGFGDVEKGKYFFNNQKFDSVVCLNVLEHIRNDEQALENSYKLLKTGGSLVLLVPLHHFLYGEIDRSIGHFRRYTEVEVIDKLEKFGFKILKHRRINFFGAIGWYISGKILHENTVGDIKTKLFNFLAPIILPFEDLIEPPIATSVLIVAKKEGSK